MADKDLDKIFNYIYLNTPYYKDENGHMVCKFTVEEFETLLENARNIIKLGA